MIRSDSTNEALLRKLRQGCRLQDWEEALVMGLPVHEATMVRDQPVMLDADTVFLMLEGWLCSYQVAGDGKRQIKSFYIAGDIPNVARVILPGCSSQYAALGPCRLGLFRASALRELCRKSAAIAGAIWRLPAVEARVAQEWIVNLGGRRSLARMAHLLCELSARMNSVGLFDHGECELPLTQVDLANALAMTNVHLNLALQRLRSAKLVKLSGKRMMILDRRELEAIADFDDQYLLRWPTELPDRRNQPRAQPVKEERRKRPWRLW